jgi:hypothetical protein
MANKRHTRVCCPPGSWGGGGGASSLGIYYDAEAAAAWPVFTVSVYIHTIHECSDLIYVATFPSRCYTKQNLMRDGTPYRDHLKTKGCKIARGTF